MRRKGAVVYAVICTLLLVAGLVACFYFAFRSGIAQTVACLCAFVVALILAPTVHETGHILMAKRSGMKILYAKFFCFQWKKKAGKLRFSLASPFAPDQTQVLPTYSENMQKRAQAYTAGGLIFGGAFALLLTVFALLVFFLWKTDYFLFGLLPYAWYLFLLNAMPLEYASGKTDALVYKGIKKGYPAEKNMLSAMQIHGELFQGKSFAEIDEKLYFDLPVLCEDEPMFAVMLDLRYRYYLEKGDLQKAGETLNRLAYIQCYLSDEERVKLAVELTFMHAVTDDLDNARKSAEACFEFLQQEEIACKRALYYYAKKGGKVEEAEILLAQAKELLQKEEIQGVKKSEEIILSAY